MRETSLGCRNLFHLLQDVEAKEGDRGNPSRRRTRSEVCPARHEAWGALMDAVRSIYFCTGQTWQKTSCCAIRRAYERPAASTVEMEE